MIQEATVGCKTGVCEVGMEEEERRKVKDSMPGKMNEML